MLTVITTMVACILVFSSCLHSVRNSESLSSHKVPVILDGKHLYELTALENVLCVFESLSEHHPLCFGRIHPWEGGATRGSTPFWTC